MTTFLGCIADDFTGATDLASMLARSGVNVSLRIGVPLSTPENTAEIEVIALKTRSISASKAIEELEDTARLAMITRGMNAKHLTSSQVKSIVKKFDVEWKS